MMILESGLLFLGHPVYVSEKTNKCRYTWWLHSITTYT